MIRNILLLVLIVALVYFGYYEYKKHQETARLDSGSFSCQGCDSPEAHARFLKENSGETADGNSEHKYATARVAAEEAEDGNFNGPDRDHPGAMQAPPPRDAYGRDAYGNPTGQPPTVVPTQGQPGATPMGLPPSRTTGGDSISPNPPNGMRFAGSGSYQWYRQGNLTWRVDTNTGSSCIIYATMEEWRKPTVMRNGCGRTAW